MTGGEAITKARALFDSTWGKDPRWNRFTGEVRVVDLAEPTGREPDGVTDEQRARAGRFFRVVFVSALPPPDCGVVDVVYRVEKATGSVTEEVWD